MTNIPLPNSSQDLHDQIAFVTGATSGLGRRFAKVLAASGAKVIVSGRRQQKLQSLTKEIIDAGGECAWFTLDMTDAAAIEKVMVEAPEIFGTITILVNNAGVPDAQLATKIEIDLIDRVLDTNIRGPFILAREVAKRLIRQKRPGRIINISSMAAFSYDGHGAALYATTKGAMARMTEALSAEWARFNVNVNAIAPGLFKSEMTDGMLDRMGDITVHYPRKRIGMAEQLDSTLLYLCSPASECVTGTVIKVDDGQMAK